MNQLNAGERIRKKREENGLSLQDIAEKLAVNRSSVMRWENGETSRIKLPVIEKLAQILKTTPQYLMGYDEDDQPEVRFCSAGDACFLPVVKHIYKPEDILQKSNVLYYELAESVCSDGQHFYLLMSGESMEPRVCEGDRILVKKQKRLQDGEVGVFLLDGKEGMIRRYQKGKFVELHAFNPYYPALSFAPDDSRLELVGRVIESRKLW